MMVTKNILKKTLVVIGICTISATAWAQQADAATTTAPAANAYDLVRYIMMTIAALLLMVIAVLGKGVAAAGGLYLNKFLKEQKGKSLLLVAALLFFQSYHAQASNSIGDLVFKTKGIPDDIYYLGLFIILEFAVVGVLFSMMFKLINIAKQETADTTAPKKVTQTIFQKLHDTVPIEQEDSLDLMHNYDGIRELDNKVPSWWPFAFYAGIVFAAVYLYRILVTETIPSQYTELAQANVVAEEQKLIYLSKAANNVDENKIIMADASGIQQGALLYAKNCVACHGDKGQGGVGPNLTDNYWLHKGSLEGIFYSIKYGWPEKGMIAWKDNFSPAQMVQLTSYVKTLVGTKPEGAKEPQGELFVEEQAKDVESADTTASTTNNESKPVAKL